MPIKNLSDKRRLPRLGKIHLGVKVTNGHGEEYPKATDYFVCPPEVKAVFGEKPKTLRIMIPVEDEEVWASQYYRCYSRSRGLVCKGDGETALRMVDVKSGKLAGRNSKQIELQETVCYGRTCSNYEKQCREIMNLQFLLGEVSGLGIWQIDTSSVNSIQNINSAADMIKRICGRISMIPLLLTLEPQDVQVANGCIKTIHVLNLRIRERPLDLIHGCPSHDTCAFHIFPTENNNLMTHGAHSPPHLPSTDRK